MALRSVGRKPALSRDMEPADHAVGRSRSGPTAKIHLACDGRGLPLSIMLSGDNVNDCVVFVAVATALGQSAWGTAQYAHDPLIALIGVDSHWSTHTPPPQLTPRRTQTTARSVSMPAFLAIASCWPGRSSGPNDPGRWRYSSNTTS